MSEQANNPNRFFLKEKLSPDEAAFNFAHSVVEYGILTGCTDIKLIERQITLAWKEGYCFGNNEMMDKFQKYIACQPPPPIIMDKNEVSLSTYKMFVCEKIKRDSNGNWWTKLKMWYKFIKS